MKATALLHAIQLKKAQRDALIAQKEKSCERMHAETVWEEKSVQARTVVQAIALETQRALEFRFSAIISTALAAILDEPYEFQAKFVERRNTMECDLCLINDTHALHPIDAVGGGVADIVGFALRISFWALRPTRNLFILDEPFKFLSAEYHEKASKLMKMLSEKMNIQFIMVSHLTEMISYADRVFRIDQGKIVEVS